MSPLVWLVVLGVLGTHEDTSPLGVLGVQPQQDAPQQDAKQQDAAEPRNDRVAGAAAAAAITACAVPAAVLFATGPVLACVPCVALPACGAVGAGLGTAIGGKFVWPAAVAGAAAGGVGAVVLAVIGTNALNQPYLAATDTPVPAVAAWVTLASALSLATAASVGVLVYAALPAPASPKSPEPAPPRDLQGHATAAPEEARVAW